MCVRAAQLRNVKYRRAGNNKSPREWNIPRGNEMKNVPRENKVLPAESNIPRGIKYSPRKWNVAIFPAAEKIFPAAKNIPRGPESILRGNECNNIPRGRENIPRGKIYSPRPRKYSPRQNIFPAAEKIFPAAKNIPRGRENIPRGRENIPRGKNFSFLCPSQASVLNGGLEEKKNRTLWRYTKSQRTEVLKFAPLIEKGVPAFLKESFHPLVPVWVLVYCRWQHVNQHLLAWSQPTHYTGRELSFVYQWHITSARSFHFLSLVFWWLFVW